MRVTIVGSGDASNAGGRAHSCYWIDGFGPRGLMVDFGATALARLWQLGRDPEQLAVLSFTHLHGDHIGGFPFLFIDALYSSSRPRRRAPLTVIGPPGTRERLQALVRVAYGKLADTEPSFPLAWEELRPGESLRLEGGTLKAFAAEHMSPPDQALCLRFTAADGRSVAFSGDTRLCEGLLAAAQGTDLLVAECTGLRPPMGKHCTWEEWVEVLPRLDARRVVFSHLGEAVRARAAELLAARPPEGPPLEFAEDGLQLRVE
ncbi:MAG: MBL fold metallo-hydrolase [Planctomycetota bacterium]|nr:MAG: MBL fold metallo-hydrolase [Planctomycetota bacterium]